MGHTTDLKKTQYRNHQPTPRYKKGRVEKDNSGTLESWLNLKLVKHIRNMRYMLKEHIHERIICVQTLKFGKGKITY